MASARTRPDALLHAAGELIGIVVLEAGEPDQLEIVADALIDPVAPDARHRKPERGIVEHRLPRQQAEMLEHHGDAVGRARAHPLAVDEQLPVAELGEAGDAAQQRGLAAAGRADHAHDLVAPHLQRQLVKGDHRAVKKQLGRVVGDDGRFGCRCGRIHAFLASFGPY